MSSLTPKPKTKRIKKKKVKLLIVYNTIFIDLLKQLEELMKATGEMFRARAYNKARTSIENYKGDITSVEQIKTLPGVGKTIVEKMQEYIDTGKLRAIEKEKHNPIITFSKIHGVGPKKAKELVQKHKITSITDLKKRGAAFLNATQLKGLKYFDDLQKRIPRDEIDAFKVVFDSVFDIVKSPGFSRYEIVGSYRRGARDSGDIDIIFSDSGEKKSEVYDDFIDLLIKRGILIDILSRGKTKCLAVARIGDGKARRIDFLYATPHEYPFATLYFTGSASFNTTMRGHANDLGYSLNEHGITMLKTKKPVTDDFEDEKSIFDFFNMVYKNPTERIDGSAVNIKKLKIKEAIKKSQPDMTNRLLIQTFRRDGVALLDTLNLKKINELVVLANDSYYNKEPILTDNEFDILKEYMERKSVSQSKIPVSVGAPIEKGKTKVKLPYIMASMDKIKPDTGVLSAWKKKYKNNNVISTKLDGVSGLFSIEGGVPKLYTRGNGVYGQDVSHIIQHIPSLMLLSESPDVITIRGEFIISKDDFFGEFSKDASNARNFVSGIVNSKSSDHYNAIDFIAYEVILFKEENIIKPSRQFEILKTLKIPHALHEVNVKNSTLTNEYLSDLLVAWRGSYAYEIDGIIVSDDALYERTTSEVKNPEHAFAFKMILSDQMAEAKVVDVLWSASKDGFLKPKIRIEPVVIGGARIEFATAFNAAFIVEQKIGVGAIIKIIRSGDVIPTIHEVVEPASIIKLPDVEWEWNSTKVDIILKNPDDDDVVHLKRIVHFFKGIEVDGLGEGTVLKLVSAGHNSIQDIINLTTDEILEIDGFGPVLAKKIHDNIESALRDASVVKLMSVSNTFGRGMGTKKLDLIFDVYPDILVSDESDEEKVAKISDIKGFTEKSATQFVEGSKKFIEFMKQIGLYKSKVMKVTLKKKKVSTGHKLEGKTVVFTGFRDKDLEKKLSEIGAKVGSTVSKSVCCVVVKDLEALKQDSAKTRAARKLGILVIDKKSFISKYI